MESNGFDSTRGVASEPEGVRWGGAWAGFVIAAAFLFLWTSLWAAIGFGSNVSFFTGNALGWWVAATVVVALWLGGFVGVWSGKATRPAPATLTALTVWGLFTLGTLIFGETMGRAAGLVIGGAAAAGRAGFAAGSLQGAVGGGIYLVFGTTIVSALAAIIGGMQAAKMLASRMPARRTDTTSTRAVDVRDGTATATEIGARRS
jgi:hypothetical protein